MLISNIKLKNWRNFTQADVALQGRQFIVGPNASGKSNFLDAFRFLRDIAKQTGGGLQAAIEKRGGVSKIRCLSARSDPEIVIGISLTDTENDDPPKWRYEIGIRQETRGHRQPHLAYERVWKNGQKILTRPNSEDKQDTERLKQTYLEQVNNNKDFREIGQHLNKITYMHLVPQLLRHSDNIQGRVLEDDPFGQGFLERMATTTPRTRDARLKRINNVIKIAVPQLEKINFEHDEHTGRPHISALYSHWRAHGARQREDQFSDGTLRLIALLWSLLENDSLLLLEEPEVSLHAGIVENMAPLLYRAQQKNKRQLLISTHSVELLSDMGIDGREALLLTPSREGTKIEIASNLDEIRSLLLDVGMSVGEAVIPRTKPKKILQLPLF